MIVVDASVAAKWVLAEPEREAAVALLTLTQRLIAPSHIRFEVSGAIIRRFRGDALDENTARMACAEWNDLLRNQLLELIPADELLPEAIELTMQLRHPLSDCLYVAAAQRYLAEFITADRELFERALPVYGRIKLLSDAAIQ